MKKTTTIISTTAAELAHIARVRAAALDIIESATIRARHIQRDQTPTQTTPVLLLPAPRDPADILHEAHIITHQVCANRYKLTAQKIMLEMDNANRADQTAHRLPEMCAEEESNRLLHDSLMEEAAIYESIRDRVTLPTAEREAAAKQAETIKARAEQAKLHADALWKRISNSTYSNAADMTQAAALALWWSGSWKKGQTAAGRESNALRKAAGLPNSRTEVTPITAEEYRAKCQTVTITKEDGTTETVTLPPERETVKGTKGRDNGFITYEYRNSPKYKGYFAVWHRPTERAVIVYDSMDSESATAATYADNGGLNAVHDAADYDRLCAMFDRAGLSERDRAAVTKAAARIMQTDAHTPEAYAECWRYGLRNAHIYSNAEQEATPERIREALTAAERKRKERILEKLSRAKAAQEAADREWERIAADQTQTAPDLVQAVAQTAAQIPPAAPVIKWTRRPHAANLTTEEAEAAKATEAAAVAAYNRRRDAWGAWEHQRRAAHQADTWTAAGSYSAHAAAAALLDMLTESETAETVQVWHTAHKAAQAAEKANRAAALEEAKQRQQAAEAAQRAKEKSRRDAFLADFHNWEKAQTARKAAEAQEAAKAAELAERRREAYNAAIRAAYAKMGTTYPKATEAQRAKATKAAQRAADKVK